MKILALEQDNGGSVKTNGPWSWIDDARAQVSPHLAWDKNPANAGAGAGSQIATLNLIGEHGNESLN